MLDSRSPLTHFGETPDPVSGCKIANVSFMKRQWDSTGKARGTLANAHAGLHSGRTMAHSSTAKGRGLLLPE